ncbi:MAG: hypothetical protein FJ145_00640 [Deltaproteobacteria bacterium]|nr:hypothetical protein [Deltaproteobacteria bacterium]
MKSRIVLSVVALATLLSGCVSVEKSYPDKRFFVLEIPRREAQASAPSSGVLMVAPLRVSPRYEGRSFVYRRSEASFESDFYNQFLVSPGPLLTEEVRRELSQAQVAQYVVSASSQAEPTLVLEGTIDALYGDFRDINAPKAVLEMEFFLAKESPAKADIVLRRRYTKSIAVSGRTPEALVRGWNDALSEIVVGLAADLKPTK